MTFIQVKRIFIFYIYNSVDTEGNWRDKWDFFSTENINSIYSGADIWKNRAFYNKSMKLGTWPD